MKCNRVLLHGRGYGVKCCAPTVSLILIQRPRRLMGRVKVLVTGCDDATRYACTTATQRFGLVTVIVAALMQYDAVIDDVFGRQARSNGNLVGIAFCICPQDRQVTKVP